MTMDGTVARTDEVNMIRFERTYAQPIERVWAALMESDQLQHWIGDEGAFIEPYVGGKVSIDIVQSTVSAIAPPHLLVYDWFAPDYPDAHNGPVRWELTEIENGTRLVMTHVPSTTATSPLPDLLGGWHVMFDRLEALLDGDPRPWDDAEWQRHRDRYAANAQERESVA